MSQMWFLIYKKKRLASLTNVSSLTELLSINELFFSFQKYNPKGLKKCHKLLKIVILFKTNRNFLGLSIKRRSKICLHGAFG